MFTFAKFVSSALGFLTVGSTGAVVAPVALDSPIYRSQDKLKSHWNLQPLRDSEQKLKTRLDSLKLKLLLALKATEAAKKFKHNLMQEKFESVKEEETNLKYRYEEIAKKIEKVSDLLRQQSQESSKKLHMQSAVSLLEGYEKYFDKLIEHFEKQKQTILEIVCTIDKTSNPSSGGSQQNQESECATAEWIKKLKESESSSSAGAGGASTSQAQSETASQQALKSLSEVRETLYGMSKEVKNYTQKLDESKEEAKKAREFLTQYISFVESLVKLLQDYQSRLKKGVESDTQASSETVKKINELNEEIVRTNKDWEKLKSQFIVLKAYEGKIVNSLCGLQTIEKPNCITQAPVEVL